MLRRFICALALILVLPTFPAQADTPVYGYRVVQVYPHDPAAFTEGLFYKDGYLYESTGMPGASNVRKVELKTGKVVQQHDLAAQYFGEGIIDWHNHLIQLTWKNQRGFVYDLRTFEQQRTFDYPGEGWALTRDDKRIYMSDGSPVLRILNPDTLTSTGSIMVMDGDKPISNLNELEWVKGEIYANIWLTNRIARIDPATGKVTGWIDLTGLYDASALPDSSDDVLNGIAYDAQHDRLFVTGKRWPKLFEIKLVPPPAQ